MLTIYINLQSILHNEYGCKQRNVSFELIPLPSGFSFDFSSMCVAMFSKYYNLSRIRNIKLNVLTSSNSSLFGYVYFFPVTFTKKYVLYKVLRLGSINLGLKWSLDNMLSSENCPAVYNDVPDDLKAGLYVWQRIASSIPVSNHPSGPGVVG